MGTALGWTGTARTDSNHLHVTTLEVLLERAAGLVDNADLLVGTLWREAMVVDNLLGLMLLFLHGVR